MKFDTHLFISYGHVDDIPTPSEAGWVTRFHQYLNSYLSAEIGEAARIWRDEQLAGNGIFSEDILSQLARTAAVASVISSRYVDSEWCKREAETFCRAAEQSGGLVIDNRMRVFQIFTKPLKDDDREKLPPPLGLAPGYPFYREVEGGRYERLDPSFGAPEIYKTRVARLAADIAELIRVLKSVPRSAPDGPTKPLIYLAECGHDRAEDRERLWSELRAHGYAVSPEQPSLLSDLEDKYVEEVSALLDRCTLSIHIVGEFAGKTPDGPLRKPVVELQNELAGRQSASRGLQRLIWVPERTGSGGWSFPDELQRNAELQRGADLITGSIEEFKSAVRAALAKIEASAASAPAAPARGPSSVYVICVEQDLAEAVGPLVQFLDAKGIQCEFPVFSGAASEVRAANEAIAERCDAAILFCGAGEGAWMQSQQDAFAKTQSGRRGRPPASLVPYLATPVTPDKQKLRWRKNVIDGFGGCSEAALDSFLRALQSPPISGGAANPLH